MQLPLKFSDIISKQSRSPAGSYKDNVSERRRKFPLTG